MENPAPMDLATALSPRWLSQALSRPERKLEVIAVRSVEKLKTMATKLRFEVDFAAAPKDEIRNFCIKGFFDEEEVPGSILLNSRAEALYYIDIAPKSAVHVPVCRYAGVDPRSGHGVILMEDVITAGGHFMTQHQSYTPEQTRGTLDQLALLHAQNWHGKGLDGLAWLTRRFDDMAEKPYLPADVLRDLLAGERGAALDPAIKDVDRIHRALKALAVVAGQQPDCLVHGDAHAGNLFEQDGKAGLIDWQVVQRGSWALDVAYHVNVALSVEDCARYEKELLRHYLDRLSAHGAAPPAWEDAWLAYRTHIVHGYYFWAIARRVEPRLGAECVRRLGLSIMRHGSFELLGV